MVNIRVLHPVHQRVPISLAVLLLLFFLKDLLGQWVSKTCFQAAVVHHDILALASLGHWSRSIAYPRWSQPIFSSRQPRFKQFTDQLSVLVAGCSTGMHFKTETEKKVIGSKRNERKVHRSQFRSRNPHLFKVLVFWIKTSINVNFSAKIHSKKLWRLPFAFSKTAGGQREPNDWNKANQPKHESHSKESAHKT